MWGQDLYLMSLSSSVTIFHRKKVKKPKQSELQLVQKLYDASTTVQKKKKQNCLIKGFTTISTGRMSLHFLRCLSPLTLIKSEHLHKQINFPPHPPYFFQSQCNQRCIFIFHFIYVSRRVSFSKKKIFFTSLESLLI